MAEVRTRDLSAEDDFVSRGADTELPLAISESGDDESSGRESFLMAIAEECRMGPFVAQGKTESGLHYWAEYTVDDVGKPYLQGACKVRHEFGLLAAFGRFNNGLRHGTWYFWGRHGEMLDQVIYNEGVREEYAVFRST